MPSLELDAADPAAAFILTNAAAADPSRRVAALSDALARFPGSLEASVRLARAQAEAGETDAARATLDDLEEGEWEWRVTWTRAVLDLMAGDFPAAAAGFDAVISELPGEPAPRLAHALALECAGREADAAAVYERLGRLDPTAPGPVFGVARCRLQAGDGEGAAAALDRVPEASSLYLRARMSIARALIAQALLLTDGQNDARDPLATTLARCAGVFQCDARGVGMDWNVAQLRGVAQALLGTVDLIAAPDQIAADFNAILQTALAKAVPEVRLRLWTPQGARVLFCKQVAPEILDLSAKATPDPANPQVRDYPTGAWSGNESRDYHFAIQVRPGEVGQRMLAGRASLLTGGHKVADAQVLATWTDDEARSAILDRTVAHYTGQGELAAVIQEGLQARQAGDEEQATRKLGRAVQLAAESGNEGTTKLLRQVVDVIDEEAGTVKLRRGVDDADAMALDTRSTKTRRIAG